MSGAWVIELAQKPWSEMAPEERAVFVNWLKTAEGRDLYLLVRYAMRFQKRSSQQRMAAVTGDEAPDDDQS
jgi:hypothetical protein